MQNRYKALLSYDGTAYWGWQKTRSGASIQETLGQALTKLSPHASLPEAASRTDRGVHAEGQVISFDLEKEWDPSLLFRALNAHLPRDIRIRAIFPASSGFHPTLQARSKEYRYRVSFSPVQDPTERRFSWAFPYSLDFCAMEEGASLLLGKKDFTALGNGKIINPICTLERIDFLLLPNENLEIQIQGDRFLYKMARNIAGLLLYVGRGKMALAQIPHLLDSKKRELAAVTAPAHGLTLYQVQYDRTQ
ncbi:MAG: tRNA pseudouridine(38-40) synthase TruA [Verrucomicrobiota bacterium]|nr:tRNA pseudouridine(38-40) synthase TruA [Verrucomicrobiota bacterium]